MGKRQVVKVNLDELDDIVESTRDKHLSDEERQKLRTALHAMAEQINSERSTEKKSKVLGTDSTPKPPKGKAPGHGRNGADAYKSAQQVDVEHESLKPGDSCPECPKGKVYHIKPKTLVKIIGQAPIQATVYNLKSLRCNLCGEIFTAKPPDGIGGDEKYDETVGSILALLKYGNGFPMNRIEAVEKTLGVPMAVSTQWDLLVDMAEVIKPAGREMIRQAAQSELQHNDDTRGQVLTLERKANDKRTGVFTTAIVSVNDKIRIATFITGPQHAGENLRDLLIHRSKALEPPIQMADAASRNAPKLPDGLQTVLANCLAHGRRHVIDHIDRFPDECRYILDSLGIAFKNDAEAKRLGLDPRARLHFHKQHSAPTMNELQKWLSRQLNDKLLEPNSGLGEAIRYLLTHWRKLTLFMTVAGAPIDNNLCERAIKKAVLHRKNAYFYRTLNGAEVGDLFMSLIHTCELNDVNAFDYLTQLQKNCVELLREPANWMPWNYKEQSQPLAIAR